MAKVKKAENSKKANKKPKSPDNNLKIQNLKINKKKPKSPDNNLKIHKLKTKTNKNNDKNKKKKKRNIIVDKEATIAEIVKKEKKKREENVNKNEKNSKNKNKKNKEKEEGYKFAQRRIKRIIKSDDSSIHVSEHSVFLINKASEKFLELFCKEAYACATKEKKKKHVEYKHLSSVVSKQKRFDFLSDFVPKKVKAGVALAETSSAKLEKRERKLDS